MSVIRKGSAVFAPATNSSGAFDADALKGLGRNSTVWVLTTDDQGANVWKSGIIISIDANDCNVQVDGGRAQKILKRLVMPANPSMLNGVVDLTELSYLNEPSILHNLDHRFQLDKIYTRAGPLLIAVNPFKKLNIYTKDHMHAYTNKTTEEPHVFLVANKAFRQMRDEGVQHASIVISGESGAGKTETTKIAMQYLATLAGGTGMEEQVLQTNIILESFGNAKTLRNNNSSRFGKLIDINFDSRGRIMGAHIETYLLEKSRVVHQARGDRGYHVFYQLCAGANSEERSALGLESADKYNYLSGGECITIKGVDDGKDFLELKRTLQVVGIDSQLQQQTFQILAAVLWLGNIEFTPGEGTKVTPGGIAVGLAAKLLGVPRAHLEEALTTRTISTGKESIVKPLRREEACDGRDALAKGIYSSLFNWLVEQINKSVTNTQGATSTISILDIYGFESFQHNSFEQLCINYANERLQQLFNHHLFKLEQEEYEAEDIDWSHVQFEDNQACLDLIESRPAGILSILDETCTVPKGTDAMLAEKLILALESNPRFKREPKDPAVFHVHHYAGPVNYDTTGFLEKNRDVVHGDLLQLLGESNFQLPQTFSQHLMGANGAKSTTRGSMGPTKTVSSRFKTQLRELVARLNKTSPHFIRCIKPNTLLTHSVYDQPLVLEQLRSCGVLEVVRIARQGFPTRYPCTVFLERYAFLLPPALAGNLKGRDVKSSCKLIMNHFQIAEAMFQIGRSKLFLRAGQIGQMEDLRTRCIHSAVVIQTEVRCFLARIRFLRLRHAVTRTQAIYWGERARREYTILLERHYASVRIVAAMRRFLCRRSFQQKKAAVTVINMAVRRWVLRCKWAVEEEARRHMEAAYIEAEQSRDVTQMQQQMGLGFTNMPHSQQVEAERAEAMKAETKQGERAGETATHSKQVDAAIVTDLRKEIDELRRQLAGERAAHSEAVELDQETANLCMDRMVEHEEAWGLQMSAMLPFLQAASAAITEGKRYNPTQNGALPQFQTLTPLSPLRAHSPATQGGRPEPTSQHESADNPKNKSAQLVDGLAGEFKQRADMYDDDCRFIQEVKAGKSQADMDPEVELKNLQVKFESWKKDFKNKLAECKAVLKKMDKHEHKHHTAAPKTSHTSSRGGEEEIGYSPQPYPLSERQAPQEAPGYGTPSNGHENERDNENSPAVVSTGGDLIESGKEKKKRGLFRVFSKKK